MSLLKKIANFLIPPRITSIHYPIEVICSRCGETVLGSVNLNNDLSIVYGDSESNYSYFCRKVLMGEKHCFQQIEVELTFDRNRQVKERKIKGGKFADAPSG